MHPDANRYDRLAAFKELEQERKTENQELEEIESNSVSRDIDRGTTENDSLKYSQSDRDSDSREQDDRSISDEDDGRER